jgi:hypothetical protein
MSQFQFSTAAHTYPPKFNLVSGHTQLPPSVVGGRIGRKGRGVVYPAVMDLPSRRFQDRFTGDKYLEFAGPHPRPLDALLRAKGIKRKQRRGKGFLGDLFGKTLNPFYHMTRDKPKSDAMMNLLGNAVIKSGHVATDALSSIAKPIGVLNPSMGSVLNIGSQLGDTFLNEFQKNTNGKGIRRRRL